MDPHPGSDTEETFSAYSYTYDGPQLYSYDPVRRPREQGETGTAISGQRREIELWCQDNQ